MAAFDSFINVRNFIECDRDLCLSECPCLPIFLGGGYTIIGTVKGPNTKREYSDSTFEQYVTILGSSKSHKAMTERHEKVLIVQFEYITRLTQQMT
jgi:hypothetical protein